MPVDLRSDTVTRPGPDMRAAMAAAPVGDDVYGEDPTVNALEQRVAALFGREAAMLAPSGSMANQIALQLSVSPGAEVLCDSDAHIVLYEMGAAAAVGGISSRTWPASGPNLDVAAIESMIMPGGGYDVETRLIAIEQTHNRWGGGVIPLSTLTAVRALADRHGLRLHCDGARIWHAHVADGVPLQEYGQIFDTLSVCLSKGLGAPVGSLVVGSAADIARARTIRKRMGGGMRQAGILAAAGQYALDHHIARLADDHVRAARLATALAPTGVVDPALVRTNIVLLDVSGTGRTAAEVSAAAAEQGVLISEMGPYRNRAVTHLDATDDDIDRAIEVLTKILG
jgi:threonine aldolase